MREAKTTTCSISWAKALVPITDDSAIIEDAASNLDLFISTPISSRWRGMIVPVHCTQDLRGCGWKEGFGTKPDRYADNVVKNPPEPARSYADAARWHPCHNIVITLHSKGTYYFRNIYNLVI